MNENTNLRRYNDLVEELNRLKAMLKEEEMLPVFYWWAQYAPKTILNHHQTYDDPAILIDSLHKLRDGYSALNLSEIMFELGMVFGGIVPNINPKDFGMTGNSADTGPEKRKKRLFIHTTRPHLDDPQNVKSSQALRASMSDLENVIRSTNGLRAFFNHCDREYVVLSDRIFEMFGESKWDKGSDSSYRAIKFDKNRSCFYNYRSQTINAREPRELEGIPLVKSESTVGYITYIPDLKDVRDNSYGSLLSLWSQSGTASILWSHLCCFGNLSDTTPLRELIKDMIKENRRRIIACEFSPAIDDNVVPLDLNGIETGEIHKRIDIYLD